MLREAWSQEWLDADTAKEADDLCLIMEEATMADMLVIASWLTIR